MNMRLLLASLSSAAVIGAWLGLSAAWQPSRPDLLLAIDPVTIGLIMSAAAPLIGSLFGGEEEQFVEQDRQSFAGTDFDPRRLMAMKGDQIAALAGMQAQVQPPNLQQAAVQQPPVFHGGVLPFPVGVTGVDPALADPSLLDIPQLDPSGMLEALQAVSMLSSQPRTEGSSRERQSQTRFPRDDAGQLLNPEQEVAGSAFPRHLLPGATQNELSQTMPPMLPREAQHFFEEFGFWPRGSEPQAGRSSTSTTARAASPDPLEVLEQAATAPSTGLRRRKV